MKTVTDTDNTPEGLDRKIKAALDRDAAERRNRGPHAERILPAIQFQVTQSSHGSANWLLRYHAMITWTS